MDEKTSPLRGLLPGLALFLAGFLVATGLMVGDELLTLAAYCGPDCRYPIPFLGTWQIYDAYGFAWTLILGGIVLGWTVFHRRIS